MTQAEPARARVILKLFIALDLAVLGLFKYANFIGGSFAGLSGLVLPRFPLGIPLAISFYTFHLISYLVDVQAGRVKVATFREYFFYLVFFPHVIAGPIVRAWQLVPQIGRTRRVPTDLVIGVHYLVTGFFLKMVVANNIGRITDRFWKVQPRRRFPRWTTGCWPSCTTARSMATSPAIRSWRWAWRGSWVIACRSISAAPCGRRRCRNSGSAGTSRCPAGYATTFISRWAAIEEAG